MNHRILFTICLLHLCIYISSEDSIIPIDSAVRIGHLRNGLTYYIRHNEQPTQRCEFHIAQRVGAILEEDNQNGLAHFLEHMAFNGTTHFPEKTLIEYFEKQGLLFGRDINAFTALDQTVYRLSNVPTTRKGILDSALLALLDWSNGISLLEEEINAERGVIMEEWRTRNDASRRLWKTTRTEMFKNSQYAKRDIIGDTAIILHFSPEDIKQYYNKWYGPDNQAIIVVGDIDVEEIEHQIKKLWNHVPDRPNKGERPIYTTILNTEPEIIYASDPEAQGTNLSILFLYNQVPASFQKTSAYYTSMIKNQILTSILSERLNDIANESNAPFIQSRCSNGEIVKEKNAFSISSSPKTQKETEALRTLLFEIERLKRYGISNNELQRQKKTISARVQKYFNERNHTENISYVKEYIGHFTSNEPIPGIEWEYAFTKQIIEKITKEDIDKLSKELLHDNPIFIYSGIPNEKTKNFMDQHLLDLWKDVKVMNLEKKAEVETEYPLIAKTPKAGKIKKTIQNDSIRCTIWELQNGVRVVLKPTENKQDEILMLAYSKGGLSLVETEDLPSAMLTTDIVSYMGMGDFSLRQLQKILSDKVVGIKRKINNISEIISGSSNIQDFETLLQLIYLSTTTTPKDTNAFKIRKNALYNVYSHKNNNPKNAFYDTMDQLVTNHSKRTIPYDTAMLEKVRLDKIFEIFQQRFSNLSDFTFFFVGNINPNDPSIKHTICQWIGSIKTNKKLHENFIDRNLYAPNYNESQIIYQNMKTPTATHQCRLISYDIPYSLTHLINLKILARILSKRFLDTIREEMGGTYSISCRDHLSLFPKPSASLIIQYDTDPDKQEDIQRKIKHILAQVSYKEVTEEELQKTKEGLKNIYIEELQNNNTILSYLQLYFINSLDFFNNYINELDNVSPQTVLKLMKQIDDTCVKLELTMLPNN